MNRVVDESLEALGLEGHEALVVAHEDTRHPHVHVIANRVDPETGKAATLGNSKLRLSRWAEGYERDQGRIRCERRVENNERRRAGEQVLRPAGDRPRHWARVRREGMQLGRARRARAPTYEEKVDLEAWRRLGAEARPGLEVPEAPLAPSSTGSCTAATSSTSAATATACAATPTSPRPSTPVPPATSPPATAAP